MSAYPDPQPPSARPASAFAALVLLVVVFVTGIAVGQSGLLGRAADGAGGPSPVPQVSLAPGQSPAAEVAPPENFDLFWQALDTIRREFVGRDELDELELTYGAIRGMVDALGDTAHSVFLTPDELAAEQESLGGSIVGIGVLLGERDGQVIVVSVVSHSPAQRAGIRAGDAIVEIDGQSTAGLAPDQLAARVRGDEDTNVDVTVTRPPAGERLTFSITRELIRIPAASWTLVPGTTIGLLRLSQFSTGSADELKVARDSAIGAGATSLILDLRGNPGGYVDQAVASASLFLRDKTVYIRETASGERIPVPTNADVPTTDLPLVVLIDQNTASSAEILSGALKSAGRGPLIGTTTFGTGTVLLHFPLSDGSSIRLAVERWLTPEGKLIFGEGIPPTEEVVLGPQAVQIEPDALREVPPEGVGSISDNQLLRAIELASL